MGFYIGMMYMDLDSLKKVFQMAPDRLKTTLIVYFPYRARLF